jgi:acyl-CoA thioester hydrolase
MTVRDTDNKRPPFTIELDVRDYELDMQGVVNNAVYQHYLEHARHRFLIANGLDFAEITRAGIDLVVTRIELDYLAPLRSRDRIMVTVEMERVSRIRFGFRQTITRLSDAKPVMRALIIGTAVDGNGRPKLSKELEQVLSFASTSHAS